MGCDIHLFVEYKRKKSDSGWQSFGKRFNPGRNYWLFGIMAQVRTTIPYAFEPRGIVKDLSFAASDYLYSYIDESNEEGSVPLEKAKLWETYGSQIVEFNGKPWKVSGPDYHSHSWLTLNEYKYCIDSYNKSDPFYKEPEYEAILAAMQCLESFDNETRIVFWFDN